MKLQNIVKIWVIFVSPYPNIVDQVVKNKIIERLESINEANKED